MAEYLPESVMKIIDQVDDSQIRSDDVFAVESAVGSVAARWKSFGKALHIRPAKLELIGTNHRNNVEECLSGTISEFLKMNYDTATYGVPSWRLIVIALAHREGGNNVELALEVAQKHGATIGTVTGRVADSNIIRQRQPTNEKVQPLKHVLTEGHSQRPDLIQLRRLSIPRGVGAHYKDFGIFLLHDTTGTRVKNIARAQENHGDPEAIVTAILEEWLAGRGIPVTWDNLIKTLRDCELNTLAQTVESRPAQIEGTKRSKPEFKPNGPRYKLICTSSLRSLLVVITVFTVAFLIYNGTLTFKDTTSSTPQWHVDSSGTVGSKVPVGPQGSKDSAGLQGSKDPAGPQGNTHHDFQGFPEPTLPVLMEVAGVYLKAKWRDVGEGLGIEQHDLNSIQANSQGGNDPSQECMRKVFVKWRNAVTSDYTWKKLAEVIMSPTVDEKAYLKTMHDKLIEKYKH